MKPSIPRFTTRRLMIAVAVAALMLGGFVWGRVLLDRRARYLFEANGHAYLAELAERATETDPPAVKEKFDPAYRAMAAYHASWERRYRWAANHPWVVIEPDLEPPVDPRGHFPFMKDHPFGFE